MPYPLGCGCSSAPASRCGGAPADDTPPVVPPHTHWLAALLLLAGGYVLGKR